MEEKNYSIRIAESTDLGAVLEIMRDNFHFEETIANILYLEKGLSESELDEVSHCLDKSIEAAFNSSKCIVAVENNSNKIVGATVTLLSENPKFGNGTNGLTAITPTSESIPMFITEYWEYLENLDKLANLFGRYPDAKKIMEVYAVAVDHTHRKRGLARQMLVRSIELARESDIPIVYGVFTSPFSTKSADRAGMRNVMEMNLLDSLDINGKLTSVKSIPHDTVSIMVHEII
uniref:N-acetyltransferase domain-containing protein n=1 Tax=Bracon brevicornis TaxID=1563983 RepID=A0A6V7LSE1_9HYME